MVECKVKAAFQKAWPKAVPAHRAHMEQMVAEFATSGCADENYLTELAKGDTDKGQFVSRVWEAMLYSRFMAAGWSISGGGAGPDFRLEKDGQKILVEAVAAQPGDPEKGGLPTEWQERRERGGYLGKFQYDNMIPRMTSVLKTKKDNHLKHIKNSFADKDTPFVIAIHDGLLGSAHGHHPCTDLPLIVHAVLPAGTPAVIEDVDTGEEIVGRHLQRRPGIAKRNGGTAPTDCFLDDNYAAVSAAIYCWGIPEESDGTFRQPSYVVVLNPKAKNPLPQPWLPGVIEYRATEEASSGGLKIERLLPPSVRPRTS